MTLTVLILSNLATALLTWRITTWWYDNFTETDWEFNVPDNDEEEEGDEKNTDHF